MLRQHNFLLHNFPLLPVEFHSVAFVVTKYWAYLNFKVLVQSHFIAVQKFKLDFKIRLVTQHYQRAS